MATDAQIFREATELPYSTSPKSESGKAACCQNNFRYGLTGNSFVVLDSDDQDEYDRVLSDLRFEHHPPP
ncbi:MAG TPA: hypothetical protein VHU83_18325 [Bryobacteraceae bacterium]|jgi:hypothetical protein|nr:hypothetical protein [Bryobacteraceae bacterium]